MTVEAYWTASIGMPKQAFSWLAVSKTAISNASFTHLARHVPRPLPTDHLPEIQINDYSKYNQPSWYEYK